MATAEEIRINAKKLEAAGAPSQDIEDYVRLAAQELQGGQAPQSESLGTKVWNSLAVPEQMSREGLNKIASMVPAVEPTGNTFRDLALNTPKIAAETLAETAPGFVSRGSILAGGALKAAELAAPAVNAAGRFIGKTAESTSGLGYKTPGVLAEAVKDPSLIFGQGKKAAGEAYDALSNSAQVSPDLKTLTSNQDIIKKGIEMFRSNNINPDEALVVRQAVDQLPEKLPAAIKSSLRSIFDAIAKEKFTEADAAFSRAVKSDALRKFWAINKTGTPSIVKGAISTINPLTAPLFSPIVQGGIATGVGMAKMAARPLVQNPQVGLLAEPIVQRFRR